MSDSNSIISRLCAACGLCCNGVLFHRVELQSGDSPKKLSALGLKLKKKQGKSGFPQPCSAYKNRQCAIYADRPIRCRRFECRLCEQIRAQEILESDAMKLIEEAKGLEAHLHEILIQIGHRKTKQPLFKRCDHALAQPADSPEIRTKHAMIKLAKAQLDSLLEREFRILSDQNPSDDPGIEWK